MASAEGGSVLSGVGYGEGCPLSSRLGGLRERRELLSEIMGGAPAENGFWHILKATERSFLYVYDKIWWGQFALASPYSKFWGTCPPSPMIYAHGCNVGYLCVWKTDDVSIEDVAVRLCGVTWRGLKRLSAINSLRRSQKWVSEKVNNARKPTGRQWLKSASESRRRLSDVLWY